MCEFGALIPYTKCKIQLPIVLIYKNTKESSVYEVLCILNINFMIISQTITCASWHVLNMQVFAYKVYGCFLNQLQFPGVDEVYVTSMKAQCSLFFIIPLAIKPPGAWFNTKMSSYQYRKSHCGDKTVIRSSYLHNRISYTGKMSSLFRIRALVLKPEYPEQTGLKMPWLLALPEHQQPWYWQVLSGFSYLFWERISTGCAISILRNDMKCKYILDFL